MLNNQKQNKSHKKIRTKKNKTEKNKTNQYSPDSQTDVLFESSSQTNSNNSDDSPNTHKTHNLKVKQNKDKQFDTIVEKTQKKRTKKNENSPRFSLFSDKTLQLFHNMLNNQKQNKSHKKIHTKKNETEKNKTNQYSPSSQIDFLFESSSQTNSNNSDDSPDAHKTHNLEVKQNKDKQFNTIVTQFAESLNDLSDTLNNLSKEKELKQNTNNTQAEKKNQKKLLTDQINTDNLITTKKPINAPFDDNLNTCASNWTNNWYQTNFPPIQNCVSQQYILQNVHLYAKIDIKKNTNFIVITLHEHEIALTLEEIEETKITKTLCVHEKTMFRCPLQSCQLKPLSKISLKKHLEFHCHRYHYNDNKKYLFQFHLNGTLQYFHYPPKSIENTLTQQSSSNQNEDEICSRNKDKNNPPTLDKKTSTKTTDLLSQSQTSHHVT